MFRYEILVLLLLYCCMDTFPPSDLCLYKYKESGVHGTKSSIVCQNIILSVLLLYCGPVCPRVMSVQCKEVSVHGTISSVAFQNIIITAVLEVLEFRVCSELFTGMIMEKKTYEPLTGLRMPVPPYITKGFRAPASRM